MQFDPCIQRTPKIEHSNNDGVAIKIRIKRTISDCYILIKSCGVEVFKIVKLQIKNIIPIEFFGSTRNYCMFLFLVKKIIYSASYECIHRKFILRGWKMKNIKILSALKNSVFKNFIMRSVVMWLADNLVKQLIRFNFVIVNCIKTSRFDFLYVKKVTWKMWCNGNLSRMIKEGSIECADPHDIRKHFAYPQFSFKPKDKNFIGYRPIVNHDARLENSGNITQKRLVAFIYELIKLKTLSETGNMHPLWANFIKSTCGKKIYGVVLDIKDAFSSVKIDQLQDVLKSRFSLMGSELTARLTQIFYLINNPIIAFGNSKLGVTKKRLEREKHFYTWKRGLLQGVKVSTSLCELYRSDFDIKHLNDLINKSEPCLLHRYLDDYFFVSTNSSSIEEFIKIMTANERINNKIHSNIKGYNNIELTYAGYIYNMETKEVAKKVCLPKKNYKWKYYLYAWRPCYEKSTRRQILRNITSIKTNKVYFNKMLFDHKINSFQKMLQNFSQIMLLICMKFEVILSIIFQSNIDNEICKTFIDKILNNFSTFGVNEITKNEHISIKTDCAKRKLELELKLVICQIMLFTFKRCAGGKYSTLSKYIKGVMQSVQHLYGCPFYSVIDHLNDKVFTID